MASLFLRPHPRQSGLQKQLLTSLIFGFFVFLFLWFFKPFGISEMHDPDMVYILSGYGLITTLIILLQGFLLPFFFRRYFDEEKWTVLKEIYQTLFVVFLIGLGNLLYSFWLNMFNLSFKSFLTIQLYTLVLAILPVTISVLFQQIRLLKKNLAETKKISLELFSVPVQNSKAFDSPVQLIAENEKDLFTALSQHIFYISSATNYIEIISSSDNKEIKRTLLRSSLKRAQTQLGRHPGFYRCHRTCIVNLTKVKSITGNAQGYKLIIESIEEQIPVSRNLNKEIVSVLKGFHEKRLP